MTVSDWTDGYGRVRLDYDRAEEDLETLWASTASGEPVDRPFMARLLELEQLRTRAGEAVITWLLAHPPSS